MENNTFKYKCGDTFDSNTKETRRQCSLCSLRLEPGVVHRETEEELKCPHTNNTLILESEWFDAKLPAIAQKMTKDQIKKDRLKRSYTHFYKEELPQINKKDREKFEKKKKKFLPGSQ